MQNFCYEAQAGRPLGETTASVHRRPVRGPGTNVNVSNAAYDGNLTWRYGGVRLFFRASY